jgi:hypothetical protein
LLNDIVKIDFIHNFPQFAATLSATQKGNWGKMNAQQMIEHLSYVFAASYGKIKVNLVTPAEFLAKAKEFLLSDKEFRENTKGPAALVPEEPEAVKHSTINNAIDELKNEIDGFFSFFHQHTNAVVVHPVFGELNFDEWIIAHYKHTLHHAKQFGYTGNVLM